MASDLPRPEHHNNNEEWDEDWYGNNIWKAQAPLTLAATPQPTPLPTPPSTPETSDGGDGGLVESAVPDGLHPRAQGG